MVSGNGGEWLVGGICGRESVGQAGEGSVCTDPGLHSWVTVREDAPPPATGNEMAKCVRQQLVWGVSPIHITVTAAVLELGRRAGLSENMLSLARFMWEVPQLECRGWRRSQGCD